MPQKNLYIAESYVSLIEEAENTLGQSLSTTFVDCVKERLAKRKALTEGEWSKILLHFWDSNDELTIKKSFRGRWIVGGETGGETTTEDGFDTEAEWSVALTAKGNLVIYTQDPREQRKPAMETYSDVNDLLQDDGVPANIRAEVAAELGADFEFQLDI